MPARLIWSAIQYQLPTDSLATGDPGWYVPRNSAIAPGRRGICASVMDPSSLRSIDAKL
jgi:hypothetical protein